MSNKFLSMIDRSISQINSLNTIVDSILYYLVPKMKASAAACSGLQYASNCSLLTTTEMGWCLGTTGSSTYYVLQTCTQWYYLNGKKFNSCSVVHQSCVKPSLPYGKCVKTCS